MNVLAKFHGKPLIHFKQGDPLKKMSVIFHLLSIYKHVSAFSEGYVNSKSHPPMTEPLAFTICKLELCGKTVVLQSCSRPTCFRLVVKNNGQNRRKAMCNKAKSIHIWSWFQRYAQSISGATATRK